MQARIIIDQKKIDEIINSCDVCNLAMIDENNMPYVVPMNFGYNDGCIYFHSDKSGKKIEILKKNPQVAVSFSTNHELYAQNPNVACSYSMSYKSVFAYGKVEFIEDYDSKIEAMNNLMKNYTDREFTYNRPSILNIKVFTVKVKSFTAKEFGRF